MNHDDLLENDEEYCRLETQYQELYTKYQQALQKKSNNIKFFEQQMTNLSNEIASKWYPFDFGYFWCAFCERVSFSEDFPAGCAKCVYTDCVVNTRGDKHLVDMFGSDYLSEIKKGFRYIETTGGSWAILRFFYHPEYPEHPARYVVYPMPEIKPAPIKTGGEND